MNDLPPLDDPSTSTYTSDDAALNSAAGNLFDGVPTARVLLRKGKLKPFLGRHPWVLDSAIDRVEGQPADGETVDLATDQGKIIGRGVYNSRSRIRVRLYSWGAVERLDRDFWRKKIESAVAWRSRLGYDDPNGAARVVFSEADGLSGLIVDRYGPYLCVQITALAVEMRLPMLLEILIELLAPRGVFLRTEKGAAQAEGLTIRDGLHWGQDPKGPFFIEEHGLRYGVDLAEGQKTGFYLDQRENRLAAAKYFRGLRVLDMFCYSGAFALTAVRHGGASEVLGVDSSDKAVALARANAALNGIPSARFESSDAFEGLEQLARRGERFGAVLLDPPKFARSRQKVEDALRAYHRLNRLGVELLEPGGILVTSSCSGHVTREDFLYMLAGVSQRSGRDVQILEQRGASADHPVQATCLETEYLKCFICRVP